MLFMAFPRPLETSARRFGSLKWVVASTMAFARTAGFSDLKIPEPTNTPSAPSCIIRDASAGVAIPPAAKVSIRPKADIPYTVLSSLVSYHYP